MTPLEKANNLLAKFILLPEDYGVEIGYIRGVDLRLIAKNQALVCVDEILEYCKELPAMQAKWGKIYWRDVKSAIQSL